jgi:Membrane domain of glycerophosphoryl diester phosphodiesterase
MTHTLRPLSLGQLLDETFNIYRRNFVLFAGISAIPHLVILVFQLGQVIISGRGGVGSVAAVLGILLTLVIAIVVGSFITAATTFGVSDIYLSRPTSISACFSRVGAKALSVIFVSFLLGLLLGLGFMLCIVPGIYFAGKYGLAIPATVLEGARGGDALTRSSTLTKNSVWRVIVVYFLTTIFTSCIVFAVNFGVLAVVNAIPGAGLLLKQITQLLVSALAGIVFGPISAIALTLVYYDQRVRNEAFDIEHMMSLMGVSGSSTPVSLPPPIA